MDEERWKERKNMRHILQNGIGLRYYGVETTVFWGRNYGFLG